MENKMHIGNLDKYSSKHIETLTNTPLAGKKILFLGSSVTYGECSMQDGIPEYFKKRFGVSFIKEAVSGTTLVDNDENSYVSRLLRNVDSSERIDLFICQLSTNDATQQKPMGVLTDSETEFDKTTIIGAIEFIIKYVKDTFGCPIMFYTGSRYDSNYYEKMVDALYDIAKKWNTGVIDLWRDDEFNSISEDERNIYMNDPIHPTKAGYMKWWCPEIEKQVIAYMENIKRRMFIL